MAENIARQVAETVAESRTRFYFLQRFQPTFPFRSAVWHDICNMSRNVVLGNELRAYDVYLMELWDQE